MRMRKLGFILLALICCLTVAAGGGESAASHTVQMAVLTIDRTAADEWRCERICNSDLNLPRAVREVTPPQASAPAPLRVSLSDAARASLRHAAGLCAAAGYLKETPVFHVPIRFSGPRVADYYVYRLRRLII